MQQSFRRIPGGRNEQKRKDPTELASTGSLSLTPTPTSDQDEASQQDSALLHHAEVERNVGAPKYVTPAFPKFVGVENAEAVVGAPYRWCRDFARLHSVPVHRNGRKLLIDAAKLFEAIEKNSEKPANASQVGIAPDVSAVDVLASLGLEVVA